jgi:hypothetical protein
MRREFLGDSKDSFKWDYHDYLVSALGYPWLNVALLLTPDQGRHGNTNPESFPARTSIVRFCQELKRSRSIQRITMLPSFTGGSYHVALHRDDAYFTDRGDYFSGLDRASDQVVFLDPDNGFEPATSCGPEHVSYHDLSRVLQQLRSDSLVTVFQHFRRVRFDQDLGRIRERLEGECYSTAVYWHSLMFVAVAKSASPIRRVADVNRRYARNNPVAVID